MKLFARLLAVLICTAIAFVACSSAPAKKTDTAAPAAPAASAPAGVEAPLKVAGNLDTAHAAFIQALDMEQRGLGFEADSLWILAWQYDPNNRFLAFRVAEKMLSHGADSLAFSIAKKANNLKGKVTVSQLETMARLYVKEGIADSARKYFVAALDSSKNQDMKLLYDYSLFLEAVQDKEELVRVYEQLLPQTNYIQSLFNRQVNLLVETGRDSMVAGLFAEAYEATGEREYLAKGVHALMLQKRYADVRAIADTITASTEHDAMIIELALLTFVNTPREDVLKFLKKKYYDDGVHVPELLYHLGLNEYILHEVDSARVHLDSVHLKLDRDPSYGAQACRILSSIALSKKDTKSSIRYAEQADSILAGEGKVFVALAYAAAKEYKRAYDILDSMLDVWSKWAPLEAVADSAQLLKLKAQAKAKYRKFQSAYADVLLMEAAEIEEHAGNDELKKATALEARQKAQLFWESMMLADPRDIQVRYSMARNLERMGKNDESFGMFEMIIKSPQFKELNASEFYNYYGYTLLNLNRNKKEVEYGYSLVLKAIEVLGEKKVPDAILDSKAWGLYRLGRFDEALEVIQKIDASGFEKDSEFLEHLAAIQAAIGNKAEATKVYKKLLKVDPANASALEFLKGKKK